MFRFSTFKSALFLSLISPLWFGPAHATPISFTGVDLLNDPNTTIVSGQYSNQGNSFRVLPEFGNSVLFTFAFDDFIIDPGNFGVRINITRQSGDFDPFLFLSDGVKHIGGELFDNGGGPDGLGFIVNVVEGSLGLTALDQDTSNGFESVPLGTNVELDLSIQASTAETAVRGILNGGLTVEGTTSFTLIQDAPLSLVFAGGGFGEDYVVNSVTFFSGVSRAIPEPASLSLLLLPLGLCALLYRRRTCPHPHTDMV